MSNDPVVEAFFQNYGVKNLLADLDVKKVQSTGQNQYVMCCLFHDERNPSFSMNSENGLWKCFGCGLVGNLYQFISLSYNINYSEAQQFIFERAGLSKNTTIEDIIFSRNINLIFNEPSIDDEIVFPKFTSEQISVFYESEDPYNYLINRGFTNETIKYFECGYTSKWRSFNEDTKTFYGQSRVIIPGHDENNNCIGFIGRTPINDEPKYKYTKGYPKSHTLFNLNRAKQFTDKGLILVEGSLDVMNVYQLGYENVCGILGASLSKTQSKLISRYTNSVYLMFDNDNAGKSATKKAIELLYLVIPNIKVIPLGDFKDPGEIKSRETLKNLINNGHDWFEFQIKEVNKKWQ